MADTITLYIRSVPPDVADRIRKGAGARGISQAEYLVRLIALVDHADPQTLKAVGLERVTV